MILPAVHVTLQSGFSCRLLSKEISLSWHDSSTIGRVVCSLIKPYKGIFPDARLANSLFGDFFCIVLYNIDLSIPRGTASTMWFHAFCDLFSS